MPYAEGRLIHDADARITRFANRPLHAAERGDDRDVAHGLAGDRDHRLDGTGTGHVRRRRSRLVAAACTHGIVATLLGVAPAFPTARAADPSPASSADTPFAATPGSAHDFKDVEHWRRVFDDPARDAWQKPRELVTALALRPGAWVADLGAGTGYFSRWLDAAVGPSGVVFAVDTEPNLVAHLRHRAEQERTPAVIPILASMDDPRLPPAALDLVLLVDTYHHLDDRRAYLARLARTLKPDGRIAIVDWQKHDLPVGPPPSHKLARTTVIDEMRVLGFTLVDEPTILPHQYFLIFARRMP